MDGLDIHPRIIGALRKAKLHNFSTILCMSGPDLERATQLSTSDITVLHKAVANAVHQQKVITALDFFQGNAPDKLQVHRLSCGCSVLDKFLKGGIISRGITEVAGVSASGKTQMCMQLCLTVQLPVSMGGLDAGAIYICTEDVFPNKRLMQIADHFSQKLAKENLSLSKKCWSDNIFIEHASDLDHLQFCIGKKIPVLLARGIVKLVIVDSVAALFRCEYEAHQMVGRAKQINTFGSQLHRISSQYNVPVVCVNQVSDVVVDSSAHRGRKVIPALGLSWANLVTTRLMLTRTNQTLALYQESSDGKVVSSQEVNVRTMEVMFAPHLPCSACYYIIDHEGIKGLT